MSQDSDKNEPQRVEEPMDPQARIFTIVAATLMVAEITFGLLNTMNIIHM